MNQQDLNQISARGISEQQIEHQLEQIKNGFPFLKLEARLPSVRVSWLLQLRK